MTVPVTPVNSKAPTAVLALVTAPRKRSVAENVAKPVPSSARVAVALASTAVRVASLTAMPEVPPRAPASVTSVPADTVVVPE